MRRVSMYAVASLLAAGCGGLETGNGEGPDAGPGPTQTIQMALAAAEHVEGLPAGRDADGKLLDVAEARVSVRRIELKLPPGTSCAKVDELDKTNTLQLTASDARWVTTCQGNMVQIAGPWLVDLVSGDWAPPLEVPHLAVPSYRDVKVRFEPADPADGLVAPGDPLAGRTLVASGELERSGGSSPYRLDLAFSEQAAFADGVWLDVPQGEATDVWLLMDAGTWFTELPLSACADAGELPISGGTVLLQSGQGACAGVESVLQQAVTASGVATNQAP